MAFSKTVTFALLLLGLLAITRSATEIQELGSDDTSLESADDSADDELGEGTGGRRGRFLSTTGSFTLSAGSNRAGNDEEDEDELGEGVGGRRGAFPFHNWIFHFVCRLK